MKEKDGCGGDKINVCYGCKSTKTICTEGCGSKCRACRNLVVFASVEEALKEGYRPCMRCQPNVKNWEGTKKELVLATKLEMEKNYYEKFSLKKIADTLYVNEDYLGRTFKSIVGETPLRYHNYVRCEHAKKLLEEECNVEMVAYKVGYMTVSHFIKVFKSICGETPLQYKKENI